MDIAGYSATGPRDVNEDSFFTAALPAGVSFPQGIRALAVVSDGMGGYQGGDVASNIVITEAEHYLSQLLEMSKSGRLEFDPAAVLKEIVARADGLIHEEIHARNGHSIGATFLAAFISPTHAWIGHVGDSRAYLIRDGQATLLTEDHSYVGRMLARGVITEEEARVHPERNKIEQALGFTVVKVDIDEVDLRDGDALMLCSDGVYTALDSKRIAACIRRSVSAADAAKKLVDRALSGGTDDNSTATVAMIGGAARSSGGNAPTLVDFEPADTAGSDYDAAPGSTLAGQTAAMGTHSKKRTAESRRSESRGEDLFIQSSRAGKESHGKRLSSRTKGIYLAVAAVLVAIMGFLMASAFSQSGGGGGGAPAGAPAAPSVPAATVPAAEQTEQEGQTVVVTPSTEPDTQDGTSDSGQQTTDSRPEGSASPMQGRPYSVGDNRTIYFVDGDGDFSIIKDYYGRSDSPELIPGQQVYVSGQPESYDSGSYLQLSDVYLDALCADADLRRDGETSFSSELSRALTYNDSEYAALLDTLLTIYGDGDGIRGDIVKLLIVADGAETATVVSSPSAPSSSSSSSSDGQEPSDSSIVGTVSPWQGSNQG